MSLPQDSSLTIDSKFDTNFGKLKVDQIKDLDFTKINLGRIEVGHTMDVEFKEINLGKLEVDQTMDLEFTITCLISKVKVICEQETNDQEKEVKKPDPLQFTNALTKNLKIYFKANRGGNVTLVFKVVNLKGNKTHTEEDLKKFEKRVELKYQTNLSIIDVIPENKIEIIKEIGKGGEATINKAIYEGEVVAIKTSIPGFGMEESKKMLYFRNKYIVEYKKSFYREINNQKHFCSMLEYAEHGCLEDVKHRIEQPILYKIMEDVCNAIQYLHQVKNVIHKDIKPQNILIFNYQEICDVNAKLTDFGTCDMINRDGNLGKVTGTEYFMAPEVVNREKYTNKCDTYSLGITLLSSLLNINFENEDNIKQYIAVVEQDNGTYIKPLANLKSDIRHLIIDCCQIDPSKRPDIKECLNRIREIRKNFGDKDAFESINVGFEGVLFALPKFDLLESVKIVVKSIKELKVTNNFIKGKLMLNFGIDAEDAINLLNENQASLKNEGDSDYAIARYYLKTKKDELNVGYDRMVTAANKSHPDAIMYIINILMDIEKGELKVYDYEKFQINKIINDLYDLNKQVYRTVFISKPPTLKLNYHKTIPVSTVIDIFSVLRKYFPICEFQYGIALLHGVGIRKSIRNAEPIFNSFRKSVFCKDEVEVQFYEAYCKCVKNNTQDIYQTAYGMLEELEKCITSEKPYYYSSALNNKGVLLYKGLGCKKDINKAFEQFRESMKLNNYYGKFNYAYYLFKHKNKVSSTNEDGMEIIRNLAKSGFVKAQRFCVSSLARHSNYFGIYNVSNIFRFGKSLRGLFYWPIQASLQLDYYSIMFLAKMMENSCAENKQKVKNCFSTP